MRVPTQSGNQGKSGKWVCTFPVREKSENFIKIRQIREKSRNYIFCVFNRRRLPLHLCSGWLAVKIKFEHLYECVLNSWEKWRENMFWQLFFCSLFINLFWQWKSIWLISWWDNIGFKKSPIFFHSYVVASVEFL